MGTEKIMLRAFYNVRFVFGLFGVLILVSSCAHSGKSNVFAPNHLEMALRAYDEGQWDAALDHLDQALEADPDNSEAEFRRAVIFQRHNRLDDAVASYRKVVRIDPNHFKAHYNLGHLYSYERQDPSEALFHYQQFVKIAPRHPLSRRVQERIAELKAGVR